MGFLCGVKYAKNLGIGVLTKSGLWMFEQMRPLISSLKGIKLQTTAMEVRLPCQRMPCSANLRLAKAGGREVCPSLGEGSARSNRATWKIREVAEWFKALKHGFPICADVAEKLGTSMVRTDTKLRVLPSAPICRIIEIVVKVIGVVSLLVKGSCFASRFLSPVRIRSTPPNAEMAEK